MNWDRRTMMKLSAAGTAGMMAWTPSSALQTPSIPIPSPISGAERLQRIAKAQSLMQAHGIGSLLIESGPSLDYFTGVQWWRSERFTGTVIPASGDPIIVTPFFEKPSVAESLMVPAEIRTWDEHVEPMGVVADYLREKGLASEPVGMEETNRYFILDKLQAALAGVQVISANPVVRGCRMIKTETELALMQAASDITLATIADVHAQLKPGMTDGEVRSLLSRTHAEKGGGSPWGLVLFGAAAALPHGTGKKQVIEAGDIVLIDTGCDVHGYQSDISRTFVVGADPTAEQRKVWDQVARGQQIANAAAQIGKPAGSVDDAVRSAYESWGYGPGYALPGTSHRTGHGIGMEGHEPVNLVHGEATPLAAGMCFSNEPGIYVPGKFGVRLEDCFHMTDKGPRWFSVPPTSLDDPIGRSGA